MGRSIDRGMVLVLLFLVGLGLVQVYSSSFIFAIESYDDGQFFFRRQLLFSFFAVTIMMTLAFIPWKWAYRMGIALWAISVLGLILTLISGIGVKVGGAQRWVQLPFGFRLEPAEFFKVSLPFAVSLLVIPLKGSLFEGWSKEKWFFNLTVLIAPFAILLQQPDFGSFTLSCIMLFALLFTFGLQWRYVLGVIAAALPLFYFFVLQVPYRMARIEAFLDPWSDPKNKGFQVIQSLLSFHSGGIFGAGPGQGQGKLFFLPEAHTDFTLAVFGEEWGFLGFVVIMLLFGFLIYRGLQISLYSREVSQKTVSMGLTLIFALSFFVNVGVVLGLLPTKGLTLPFLSYGGSSLVSVCIAFGFLLNIDRSRRMGET